MSGVAKFAPYSADGSRLALAPIRFAARARRLDRRSAPSPSSTGRFPGGRVRALRLPISGRDGQRRRVRLRHRLRRGQLRLSADGRAAARPTRLPVCPVGPAIIVQAGRAGRCASARGSTAWCSPAGSAIRRCGVAAQRPDRRQAVRRRPRQPAARPSRTPIIFDAARLRGTFAGSGISGTFAGADATIGNVPVAAERGRRAAGGSQRRPHRRRRQ